MHSTLTIPEGFQTTTHIDSTMADQLDEIQWKSPEFIQERGLHTSNVLEYFSLSPFYDRTSNNQVLMMQFQFQQVQIPIGTSFQQYFQSKLLEMTGVEFIVAYTREPDFWIVRKQKRYSSTQAVSLQDYYIIGANVYQAPKVYDVLSSRLLSSVLLLKNSVDLLNKMTNFQILDGSHTYNYQQLQQQQQQQQVKLSQKKSVGTPVQTPQTAAPTSTPMPATVGSAITLTEPSLNLEVSASTFDSLLNNVIQSGIPKVSATPNVGSTTEENVSIYIDDIPMYGRGSTVEMFGLKVNLDDDGQ